MRFTVGGDAEHHTTVEANAAFLLLLVHVLPFTIMLRSTLGFFFFFLFSAHARTATARYRSLTTQFAEILRSTAFNSAVEIIPFDAVPLGANSLSIRLWACTFFYSWCWYYTTHLGAAEIAVTC